MAVSPQGRAGLKAVSTSVVDSVLLSLVLQWGGEEPTAATWGAKGGGG